MKSVTLLFEEFIFLSLLLAVIFQRRSPGGKCKIELLWGYVAQKVILFLHCCDSNLNSFTYLFSIYSNFYMVERKVFLNAIMS